MSEVALDERSRTESGLEVVIHPTDGDEAGLFDEPTLGEALALLTALKDFVDAVVAAGIGDPARLLNTGGKSVDAISQMRLHVTRAQLREEEGQRPIRLRRISMNSPLTVELLATGVTGASVISTVVYLFKNPDKIGSWFPKLQTSWYNGRAEAEKAKKAYEKLRKARTEMRELQR